MCLTLTRLEQIYREYYWRLPCASALSWIWPLWMPILFELDHRFQTFQIKVIRSILFYIRYFYNSIQAKL